MTVSAPASIFRRSAVDRQLALRIEARGRQLALRGSGIVAAALGQRAREAAAILSHIHPSETRPIRSM